MAWACASRSRPPFARACICLHEQSRPSAVWTLAEAPRGLAPIRFLCRVRSCAACPAAGAPCPFSCANSSSSQPLPMDMAFPLGTIRTGPR
jgi:hypothetical protein